MKAAWYETNGPARTVLTVGTMPDPEPGPGEVRVRIAASGVNPSDVKTRAGSRPMVAPRVIPHSDGAGTIDRVGSGVAQSRIGERVWIWNGQWKRPFGTAAEFIVLPADQTVTLPEGTSFEEGACLGIPALTAYRAVTVDGPVEGRSVFVAGGAGAVGHYAVQFAKLLGAAQVIATVSSEAKAAHARDAGADVVIDYKREDVVQRVREATGGRGVDRVVEVDATTNMRLLPQIVRQDGLCVVYGSSKNEVVSEFGPMVMAGVAVRWFIVYELAAEPRSEAVATLNGWLAAGKVRHALAASYPLDEITAAHEMVESFQAMGNVVVTI
ncbi:NADPH:quinone reductase [Enterovirga rhinocerotis]|uniref:NADPH2:quinone reductase n=1 Tax=Enterovirga rhinocerotis TaxID=1339210 RepID=A0A4V3DXS1_9HYPH|nr:NADPH:quinone reductase [Enterovirga rhinocerotis]TDR89869.1 NADPH2:quinone reductase [Enterovirga rhinocerotis]